MNDNVILTGNRVTPNGCLPAEKTNGITPNGNLNGSIPNGNLNGNLPNGNTMHIDAVTVNNTKINLEETKKIPVYNFSCDLLKKPFTWKEFMELNEAQEPKMPSSVSVSQLANEYREIVGWKKSFRGC